jgi:hypothetical protein
MRRNRLALSLDGVKFAPFTQNLLAETALMSSQTNVLGAVPWKAVLDELGAEPSSELFIKAVRLFIDADWNISLLDPIARTLAWDEAGTDEFGNLLSSFTVEFVESESPRHPSEGANAFKVDPERAKQGAELAAKLNEAHRNHRFPRSAPLKSLLEDVLGKLNPVPIIERYLALFLSQCATCTLAAHPDDVRPSANHAATGFGGLCFGYVTAGRPLASWATRRRSASVFRS